AVHDSWDEARSKHRTFDVVSCFEVIEHVAEPIGFVRELAALVRPGGHLLVMTDNFEAPAVRALRGGFPKWIPHSHVSHFSPETLRRCVEAVAGLTVERVASFTPWDMVARQWRARLKPPPPDDRAFDLAATLATEMSGDYRLYWLRYAVNPLWARWRLTGDL